MTRATEKAESKIGEAMISTLRRDLDPLDLEILERALGDAWAAIKERSARVELDSDQELEAALRRELIKMARSSGVSDPEVLRDMLVADLMDRWGLATKVQNATDEQSDELLVSS